ncbi:DUF4296 domain-containing protein [Pedobacter punctiformis]|uniref:DUF4296 domain-containing protein n=1 Tax=Pedobacter punctiformis TaxID=3004097 RepID=A0ABT4L7Y4_9SPHI|nr:DUF4296 domain-containing protein [Pedobacter sp. HCMS5-2]MCZ4244039.1 DUF4296 domain-containing protein [Pedobacter sp. HCMS5-2]
MRRLIWVLVLAILWIGCKSGIPKDVIKPDKMEEILYDIHVADGYISTIYVTDSAKKVAASFYKGIYKKFGIDSVQYNRSMKYYNSNTEELSKIYKNISRKLEWQKNKMQKIESAKRPTVSEATKPAVQDKAVESLKKTPKKLEKADSLPKNKPEQVKAQ